MARKKLTEVCDIQYGYPFDASKFSSSPEDGMPLVRIRDVKDGHTETYFKGDYPKEYTIHKGDFLVGMDGEFNIAAWQSEEALLNQRVCKIESKCSSVSTAYLFRFLKKELKKIEDETPFVTVKHLSAKRLNQVELDVPSLEEQERIVAELDLLTGIIDKQKAQLKELDTLAQSIFYDMFGQGESSLQKWDLFKLNEICVKIVDCPHTTPVKSLIPTQYPCIRTSELKGGGIKWDTMQYLTKEEYLKRVGRLIPEEGDIVYGREGSFGDAVLLPKGYFFSLGQRTMLFRCNSQIVNNSYLHRVLLSEIVYHQAIDKNVSSTVAHVNVKDIKNFIIPVPPLALQESFAAKIEAIESQKQSITRSIADTQKLFDYTMDKYFG